MPTELPGTVQHKGKRRTYRRGKGSGVTPYPSSRKVLARADQKPVEPIKIQGVFFFDQQSSTHDQFCKFLWDGIRFLAKEAEAKGLAPEQRNLLLNKAFDCFHSGSADWWAKLKQLAAEEATCVPDAGDVYVAQQASLDALAADHPTPVEHDYRPDYDIASPDESQC